MTFDAELKETKQAKLVSMDNAYSLKFVTDDPEILELGKLSPDTLFRVTVEPVA